MDRQKECAKKDFVQLSDEQGIEIVKDAIKEAFNDDSPLNIGSISDESDKKKDEYYLKLAKGDKDAKKEQEKMLERFLNDDGF